MDWEQIYRNIANQCNTTADEVKREIDDAIWEAFMNPEAPPDIIALQNQVPRKGEVPTREEFLSYLLAQF